MISLQTTLIAAGALGVLVLGLIMLLSGGAERRKTTTH